MTHAGVYLNWGLNPFGHHLVNLLLHAANAVVFYYVVLALRRKGLRKGDSPRLRGLSPLSAAAVGALFFALHPLRVEAVAWATERREVLCAFFFLLTLLLYLRMYHEQRAGHRAWRTWFLLSIGCYALSLLSKAMALTLPAVLLVLDVYPLGRFSRAGRGARPPTWVLLEKVPYAVLAGTAATIALVAVHRGAMIGLAVHGPVQRMMQAAYGLCFYLWKTLLPIGLAPLYLLEEPLDPTKPTYLLCALIVVGVTATLIVFRRRYPWALAAWTCYVAIVSPVLGVAQSGPQQVADRYTYLSCLPWAVLAAAGVYQLGLLAEAHHRGRRIRAATVAVAAMLLALLGTQTFRQTRIWKDSVTLWTHVLAIDPTNYIAYNSRGDARVWPSGSSSGCRVAGDLPGAVADYGHAVRFAPPRSRHRATFEGNLAAARA